MEFNVSIMEKWRKARKATSVTSMINWSLIILILTPTTKANMGTSFSLKEIATIWSQNKLSQ